MADYTSQSDRIMQGEAQESATTTTAGPSVELDAEFQRAKTLLNQEKFDEASNIFSSLLASRVEAEGEVAPGLAVLYYMYGTAMLGLAKKESVDLLSTIMRRKVRERSGEPADEDDEDDEGDEEAAATSAEESLEIAWEVLDTARVIWEKDEAQALRLADVHMRLAEVHEESDNIAAAIEEYKQALALRLAHVEPHSRLLAEVYSCLAFDYSLEKQNAEARSAHVKAAECVEKKLSLLESEVASSAGDKGKDTAEGATPADTDEIAELRAILEDLREKIDALKDADAEDAAVKDAGAMFRPPQRQPIPLSTDKPVTTAAQPAVLHLGVFGRSKKVPLPSSSSPASTTTTTATTEGEETKGKRKREERPVEEPTETPSAVDADSAKSDDVALKKPRTEQ